MKEKENIEWHKSHDDVASIRQRLHNCGDIGDYGAEDLIELLTPIKDILTQERTLSYIGQRFTLTEQQKTFFGTWKRIFMIPFSRKFLEADMKRDGIHDVLVPRTVSLFAKE